MEYSQKQPLVPIAGEEKPTDLYPLSIGVIIPPWNFPWQFWWG